MSTDQIMSKILASQGKLDFSKLRNPWQLSDQEWQTIHHSVSGMNDMRLFFNDAAKQTPASLRSACYQLMQYTGKPLTAILIDYVQLMHGSNKHYPHREAEVAAISGELRALAKDFACPVIVLSQLNRALENRPDKRPILSDLRESGALEQDAACVIFIYRDEVYKPKTRHQGMAELIIAKHRGGKTGTVHCAFLGHQQRFANLSAEDEEKIEKSIAKKPTKKRQQKTGNKIGNHMGNNTGNNTSKKLPSYHQNEVAYQACAPYPAVAKERY